MLDRALIEKKLQLLSGYFEELRPLIEEEPAAIAKDSLRMRGIERLFQLAVDAMIDINIHIIRERNVGAPDDLQSTFKLLGTAGVLEHTFAEKISPIVGARNMLVHQYEKIETGRFLRNLKNKASDFTTYMSQVHAFLNRPQSE